MPMRGAPLQARTVEPRIAAHTVQGYARHPVRRLSEGHMVGWRFEAQPTPPPVTAIRPALSQRALQPERLPERRSLPRVPTIRRLITRLTIPEREDTTIPEREDTLTGN